MRLSLGSLTIFCFVTIDLKHNCLQHDSNSLAIIVFDGISLPCGPGAANTRWPAKRGQRWQHPPRELSWRPSLRATYQSQKRIRPFGCPPSEVAPRPYLTAATKPQDAEGGPGNTACPHPGVTRMPREYYVPCRSNLPIYRSIYIWCFGTWRVNATYLGLTSRQLYSLCFTIDKSSHVCSGAILRPPQRRILRSINKTPVYRVPRDSPCIT